MQSGCVVLPGSVEEGAELNPPGSLRGVVRREQEVLLREGHLTSLTAHGDQWEAFL